VQDMVSTTVKDDDLTLHICVLMMVVWDASGFVRLFYILSKNKIFLIFVENILDF